MEALGLLNYWVYILLMMIGLYAVIAKSNLIRRVIGLGIFQTAIFLFFISVGKLGNGTAPVRNPAFENYSNPLTHALILTAIVVGVATTSVGLALIVRIKEAYGTIEDEEILQEDAKS